MFKLKVKEIESGFVHETMIVSFKEAEAIEKAYQYDDFYQVVITRIQNVRGLGQNQKRKKGQQNAKTRI